ncbi:hypothetical protein EPH_0029500 [Eimeria praecox]|uniref:Uncharacterized protein n=1 Tax=Eimeria praecox TaxID=51316 RepID=U6G178_9EIME|nr:hypothetical protein EPH_0029500 [Eimeria praecox]
MHIAAAAKPAAPPPLRGWSDSAREALPGESVSPATSRSLRKRRNWGISGPSASMLALAAVAAVVATYLVLRCALHLESASSRRGAQRYLAGSEGRTNKDLGGPCDGLVEDLPAAAAVVEEGEEVLFQEDWLGRARHYAADLRQLIDSSAPLLLQLNTQLKAKCIAALLCLSVVELSASFSLLEGRERAGMEGQLSHIASRIISLQQSLGEEQTSRPGHPHAKGLFDLFNMLTGVKPVSAVLAPRHRLTKIKQLLQLQDVALVQLNAGLVWLRASLEMLKQEKECAQGAAGVAAECAASPAGGSASSAKGRSATGAAAAEGAAPATENAESAADARVAAVVRAIERTVYERKTQVLRNPLLSIWLREMHAQGIHYGIVSTGDLETIGGKPLATHLELLEALQNSPLGSGKEFWERIRYKGAGAPQSTASPSVPSMPSPKQIVSSSEDLNSAARLLGPLEAPRQGPRRGAGATGSASVSASPSTSLATPAAAAERNKRNATVQGTGRRTASSFRAASKLLFQVPLPSAAGRLQGPAAASKLLFQVPLPSAAGRLQGPAVPSAPKPAAAFSAWNRSLQGTHVSKAVSATSVSRAVGYSPSADAPPRRPPSPSRPAVSTAAPNIPENYMFKSGAATRGPIASAAPAASWASAVAHGPSPGSAASQLSLAAPAQPPAGLHPAPGASGPCLEDPFPPLPRRHVTPARFPFLASTARDWPLQPIGAGGSPLRQTGKHMSEPAASVLEAVASQPVPVSPFTQAESHSSSETSNPRIPVDIYGVPISFGVWGLPERGLRKPVAGLLPNEEDDQRRPPSPATIAAGFEQLAALLEDDQRRPPSPATIAAGFEQLAALFSGRQPQRFSGTAHQQPGEAMQRSQQPHHTRQPPAAAPTPTAGAAALAAAAHSSPASVGPGEGSWSPWGYRLEGSFWPFSRS